MSRVVALGRRVPGLAIEPTTGVDQPVQRGSTDVAPLRVHRGYFHPFFGNAVKALDGVEVLGRRGVAADHVHARVERDDGVVGDVLAVVVLGVAVPAVGSRVVRLHDAAHPVHRPAPHDEYHLVRNARSEHRI